MTQKANSENLLIDFNNLNVDDECSSIDWEKQNSSKCDQNDASTKTPPESMAFLCSSEPLYKLLNSGCVDADDNNPFDHFDKQACLSDDPFEIVENAAIISCRDDLLKVETELAKVETGTLISIESPTILKSELKNESHSKTEFDTPKRANPTCETHDSVQSTSPILKNISPKSLASSTGKSRGKAKSTSLNLLKYSLSNNRLDLVGESGSHDEEMLSGDETTNKKQKLGTVVPCDSSKDDSFDDIWATKPNLIDSQTDIEIDSDVDNDLAKLNIPMLNISTSRLKSGEKTTSKEGDSIVEDLAETKAVNRSEILEKFASFKQKFPQSPMTIDTSTEPVQNQTVDVKCAQSSEDEPATPKSQYSTVLLQQDSPANNTNSLIENLMKLVNQCDDKSKQSTAKHLLDDLSSILKTTNKGAEDQERPDNLNGLRPPQLIKRQGTFSIEKNTDDAPKVVRRRSLQGPTLVDARQPAKESEPVQIKPLNPVTRRRSFQSPSPSHGIRSPSPKPSLNSNVIRPNAPLRLQCSTTGTLTRRKSLANDLTNSSKDSPQKLKSSYGIMKKPPAPPATRNLKIRVSQAVSGRSTVPMRAVVPMNRVASKLLINETVSSIDDKKGSSLITSTPRSIPSPTKSMKAGPSAPPEESPIPSLQKDRTYLSMTPPKPSVQATYSNVQHRRRTLSDYRSEVNNSVTVDSNASGKTVSSIKNATKTLASGLSKFKRMSGIGLKKRPSMGSKENKQS